MAPVLDRVVIGLLAVGAAARLTRLATSDTITDPLRDRLLFDPDQRAAMNRGDTDVPAPADTNASQRRDAAYRFVTCPWCVGMWISAATTATAATVGHTKTFRYGAGALACSYVVGALASTVDSE